MTEQLKQKLSDSKGTRWGALLVVAFTMMAAYYVNDVVLNVDMGRTNS